MTEGESVWDFFVSYTPEDQDWAEWIAWQLEDTGEYQVLLQAWDGVPGSHWTATLHDGVQRAGRTLAVVSRHYLGSVVRQAEWRTAWEADPSGEQRKLILIRVEDCALPGLLRGLVPVDLFGHPPDDARNRLLAGTQAAAIGRAKPVREPSYPSARAPEAPRTPGAPPFPSLPSIQSYGRYDPNDAVGLHGAVGDLAAVANDLAAKVGAQWSEEIRRRRLSQMLLPVRWVPADPDLVTDWSDLVGLATTDGAGWPDPSPDRWASHPGELAGGARELADVLDRVPTGRLLVLGEPGAGKSVLLVRLVLDLLERRRKAGGGPVPVLLSLGSWNSTGQSFDSWVQRRLDEYGLLARSSRKPDQWTSGQDLARRLLDARVVTLLLDGLDEIPGKLSAEALSLIDDGLRPGLRVVVTARVGQYRTAVRSIDGTEVRLTGTAGVELCPLEPDAVAGYLRATAGGPDTLRRWEPVLRGMTSANEDPGSDHGPAVATVKQALATPLAITLARAIYSPRPGERTGALPDPAELLDAGTFPDPAAVERHLLDGFLPAAYRSAPGEQARWRPDDAQRWLTFLAGHLEHTLNGSPDLTWWRLAETVPRRRRYLYGCVGGLVSWIVVMAAVLVSFTTAKVVRWAGPYGPELSGFFGLLVWPLGAVWLGLLACFVYLSSMAFSWLGGVRGWGTQPPARALRLRLRRRHLKVVAVTGLVATVASFGTVFNDDSPPLDQYAGARVWSVVLAIPVLGCLTAAVLSATTTVAADISVAPEPGTLLKDDRKVFGVLLCLFVLGIWVCIGGCLSLAWTLSFENASVAVGGAMALAGVIALPVGFAAAIAKTAWGPYAVIRWQLARRGLLPRRLTEFLDDAHQRRDVLRRVGAVYQFRHIELQRRLAGSAEDPNAAWLAAQAAAQAKARVVGLDAIIPTLARGEDELTWSELVSETFTTGSNGRLVVLGDAGSGRTAVLARLVLELAACRPPGGPVPVLVPLASWRPDQSSFVDWLEQELKRRHLRLTAFAAEASLARSLLETKRILPVLDGLDDVRPEQRHAAVVGIFEWLGADSPMILSTDDEAYRAIEGDSRLLRDAQVVAVRAAAPPRAADFLNKTEPECSPSRWAAVLAALADEPTSPVARALRDPLVLDLLRTGYQETTGERSAGLPDPTELCDIGRFPSPEAVRDRLAQRYLHVVYADTYADAVAGDDSDDRGHGRAKPATRPLSTLSFLAGEVAARRRTTSLGWWELHRALPRAVTALPLLVAGAGLGAVVGSVTAYPLGIVCGIGGMALVERMQRREANRKGPRVPRLGRSGHSWNSFTRRLRLKSPDSSAAAEAAADGPRASMRLDRRFALLFVAPVATASAPLTAGYAVFLDPIHVSTDRLLVGLAGALCMGLSVTLATPWGLFVLARRWLAWRHRLPPDILGFLDDAYERGVLLQSGGVWEFRHHSVAAYVTRLAEDRNNEAESQSAPQQLERRP